jgi:SAM-dependent methyltransferase
MFTALREKMFQIWYWYVNNADKNSEILFMNYGYSNPETPVTLPPSDEPNRYSTQLYHLLASAFDCQGKDIAEIGCGRGGGLSYVVRTFNPEKALGIDLDKNAIKFCNEQYNLRGLRFAQGDAQNLSFLPDASFDAIFNVESSHRYPQFDSFLQEVHRLLRPGGYFLYTDFRYDHEMEELRSQLRDSNLELISETMITDNVVKALEADDERKRKLIKRLAPRIIRKVALNFAGTIGSSTYNQFATHKYEYYFCVLRRR